MNKEEYDAKIQYIGEQAAKQKSIAARDYALTNSVVNVGDFVCDHLGFVLVDKIDVTESYYSKYPECVYSGVEHTKKMVPKKKNQRRSIYQTNIPTITNQETKK
jgi:hypothetical protein